MAHSHKKKPNWLLRILLCLLGLGILFAGCFTLYLLATGQFDHWRIHVFLPWWNWWEVLIYMVGIPAAVIIIGLGFFNYIWFPIGGAVTDHPWITIGCAIAGLVTMYWDISAGLIVWALGLVILIFWWHIHHYLQEREEHEHEDDPQHDAE